MDTAYVRGLVRLCVRSQGLPPATCGSHSLRIGGASTLLAAGVPPAVIQIMGRWDSEVYKIYCRMSGEAARRMGAVVASTQLHDTAAGYRDEELTWMAPARAVVAKSRRAAEPKRQSGAGAAARHARRARTGGAWGLVGHVTHGHVPVATTAESSRP